jgi:excisionase family DNA binding protein
VKRVSASGSATDKSVAGGKAGLLSVRHVARLLGVSTATIYKLPDAGTLSHFRVGTSIRIDPMALETLVAPPRFKAR